MSDRYKYLCTLLLLVLLIACGARPTTKIPQASPSMIIEASTTPSTINPSPIVMIPTDAPVPASATDTAASPSPTNTPAPQGLNPDGPYVLFNGHSGIWITNPDGSFATKLYDNSITSDLDLHPMISPTGDRMALVVNDEQGLNLVMINIPNGETEIITRLIEPAQSEIYDPVSPHSFATYAIRDYPSLAWQPPDGRLLAFTGAINGPTSDLYLYDTMTKEITQLTDGPSQAVMPVWSPDGQYILHFGVSWVPPFGGAIGGANQFDGSWAVRASDGEVISLPKNDGSNPHFIGWQDDSRYITFDTGECSSENLHTVDIVTGDTTPIMEASFYHYIAQSTQNGSILFSSADGCEGSLGEGIFLLPDGQATATQVHDVRAWEIDWMLESQVFDGYPEGLFSADGQTYDEPPVYNKSFKPALSKQGYQAWVVIEDFKGRVEVRVPGGDWQTILNASIDELIWDPLDGQTLLIATYNGLLYSATYPAFAPQLIGNLEDGVYQVIWTP